MNKLIIASLVLTTGYCYGMQSELVGDLKNQIRILNDQLKISQDMEKKYDRQLADTKIALEKTIVSGKADVEKLNRSIADLERSRTSLREDVKNAQTRLERDNKLSAKRIEVMKKQSKEQEAQAKAQEDKMLLENTKLLNKLVATEELDNQEINKLKLNIELLQNRLTSQRARADKLWIELQAVNEAQEAQQSSTRVSPVTRFFNWLRSKKQQSAE